MIKVDLITGFLGSGKTTFIKEYAQYLISSGQNIGILENDFGAVNVDMMLLAELEGDSCDLEMIAGGCDKDCHIRRFKTKLIAMGMLGYDRVLVEPSGIFDVDEFFDILNEEPIDRWYEIGSVITIIDGGLASESTLVNTPAFTDKSRYMLASQISCSGCVILSRTQDLPAKAIDFTLDYIDGVLGEFGCAGRVSRTSDGDCAAKGCCAPDDSCADDSGSDYLIIRKDWAELDYTDYEAIMAAGYKAPYIEKLWFDEKDQFQSLYYMNTDHTSEQIEAIARELFGSVSEYGDVFRIKGFLQLSDGSWLEVNATRDRISFKPIIEGQRVIIVIGEGLNEENINQCFRRG